MRAGFQQLLAEGAEGAPAAIVHPSDVIHTEGEPSKYREKICQPCLSCPYRIISTCIEGNSVVLLGRHLQYGQFL